MKITFLGGGNMANALIGGLLAKGFEARDIVVVEMIEEARRRLGAQYGVRTCAAPDAAALACDVLVLAVKPQQMREACAPLVPHLGSQLVVSIAAGIRLADLSRWLGGHALLVRTMPNTPALVGAGVTGMCASPKVSPEERTRAEKVLAAVGETAWIEREALMDAVTAVSGSGPAYVFYFIESMVEAGVELGLPADTARRLALATFSGAAKLAAQSDEPVDVLRARVTSKGGTTEAALKSMEAGAVKAAIKRALFAADARGRELGELLGKD